MRSCGTLIAIAALAAPAQAGRTNFGWLQGPSVQPERGVELMSSIYEEVEGDDAEMTWWLGPLIGVTDRIELGLPLELVGVHGDGARLDRFGVDLRYRFVTQDPVEAPAFVPLVRLAVNHVIGNDAAFDTRSDLVLAYQVGRVELLVDAGLFAQVVRRETEWQLRPGAGASVRLDGELRAGVEAYAQVQLVDASAELARSTIERSAERWLIVGPNIAWTHGRIWLSAAYGIGLAGIDSASKAQWGIAF
jgi:hypothetical protein